MPKLSKRLAENFIEECKNLDSTRAKSEILYLLGDLTNSDIETLYAGLFLELFTNFELLIEDLFIGLLKGEYYSKTYSIVRKVKFKPVSMIRKVLHGNRSYLDWLPYRYTQKRANLYFDQGKPFTLLSSGQILILENYSKIRNAIAHKSKSALNKFKGMIRGLPLRLAERTPTGYLMSIPSPTSSLNQYQLIMADLIQISRKLCT